MNQYLFVYGTLLSSYENTEAHEILHQNADLVGAATMHGRLYMVDYYPGVVPCNENILVKGELYKLKNAEKLFEILDKYEEYNPNDIDHSEYLRSIQKITLKSDNTEYDAWTYVYNQPVEDLELLPKGDFLREYHK